VPILGTVIREKTQEEGIPASDILQPSNPTSRPKRRPGDLFSL